MRATLETLRLKELPVPSAQMTMFFITPAPASARDTRSRSPRSASDHHASLRHAQRRSPFAPSVQTLLTGGPAAEISGAKRVGRTRVGDRPGRAPDHRRGDERWTSARTESPV